VTLLVNHSHTSHRHARTISMFIWTVYKTYISLTAYFSQMFLPAKIIAEWKVRDSYSSCRRPISAPIFSDPHANTTTTAQHSLPVFDAFSFTELSFSLLPLRRPIRRAVTCATLFSFVTADSVPPGNPLNQWRRAPGKKKQQ
jgi:hypothetical protein